MPLLGLKGISTGDLSKTDFVRFALEFIIVFGGVYLAFVLTDYQEELRKGEVRLKYYQSLVHEFESFAGHLANQEQTLLRYEAILEEIEQGNRPLIPVSRLTFLIEGGVIDSAFEGENFASLDSRVLANIVRGRPLLESLNQRINQLNQLTSGLVPMQLSGENCCYDSEGRLLPQLDWYPELVGNVLEINRILQMVITERALPDIKASMTQLEELLGVESSQPESAQSDEETPEE